MKINTKGITYLRDLAISGYRSGLVFFYKRNKIGAILTFFPKSYINYKIK